MLSSPHTTRLPTSSTPKPSAVTSDPCCISMETYWREVRSIEEEEGEEEEGEEGEDEAERKSMDGKPSWLYLLFLSLSLSSVVTLQKWSWRRRG